MMGDLDELQFDFDDIFDTSVETGIANFVEHECEMPRTKPVTTHKGDGVLIMYNECMYFVPAPDALRLCDLVRDGPSARWHKGGLGTTKRGALLINGKDANLIGRLDTAIATIIDEYHGGGAALSYRLDWGDAIYIDVLSPPVVLRD